MSQALAMVPPPDTDIFTGDRLKLIRDKFANGAPQHEFELFIEVCRTLNLDPLQRQVYLIPRNAKQRDGSWGKTWTIQTSIDGYRAIADRTGAYAGSDDAIFTEGKDGKPATATVTVWKFVQGTRCPFTATARWAEYVQEQSPMWGKMPHTLLAKCAESLALRKAFPAQLSGVYTDSEMEQAGPVVRDGRVVDVTTDEIIDTTAREIAPGRAASPPRTQEATPAATVAPEPTSQSTTAKERTADHRTTQNRRYHGACHEAGFSEAATKLFALSFFPDRESRTQLTGQELSDLADIIAPPADAPAAQIDLAEREFGRAENEAPTPLVEYGNRIAAAIDRAELARIAAEMKENGVATDWLRAMWKRRNDEVPAFVMAAATRIEGEAGNDKHTG